MGGGALVTGTLLEMRKGYSLEATKVTLNCFSFNLSDDAKEENLRSHTKMFRE